MCGILGIINFEKGGEQWFFFEKQKVILYILIN